MRWGRALLAAFLAEVALALVAAPVLAFMGADSGPTHDMMLPPASFVLVRAAGWRAARRSVGKEVMTGVLTGVWAVVIYVVLAVVASQFETGGSVGDAFSGAYLIAHLLKIAGAALGGWIASRRTVRPAA